MEKSYTIEQIYEVAKSLEDQYDYVKAHHERESEEYQRALSWYTACSYMFYAVTGVHYNDYEKENKL